MNLPRLPALSILSLLPLLSVSGAALADDAAILKCRALGETQARLACYDRIPVGAQPAAALATTATTAPAAAAPAATAEQRFGLEQVKRKEAEPQSIESTIEGDFSGWEAGAQIRLANGQVWRVVDGSSAVLSPMKNPKVKVTRNILGTLFLEIEGTNNSPKVRRVR
jgi:hypothetical protein